MHPNARFHIGDQEEMAATVRSVGFGVLVAQTEAGLRAVHTPALLQGDRLRFHVSRRNAVYPALSAGCEALFAVNGPDAYVSPDWYGVEDRVPTWSYIAVELAGTVRPLGAEALIRLLDDLSAFHEEKLAPKRPWTRDKMSAGRFEGLLKAIGGFEMEVADWRGTAKYDQDKAPEIRARLSAALESRGEAEMAALVRPPAAPTEPDA